MTKPRERLQRLGARALSETELLAILLSTGRPGSGVLAVAAELIDTFGGVGLAEASIEELCRVSGVGIAKATRLSAALEFGRRLMAMKAQRNPVQTATDAFAIVAPQLSGEREEHVIALLLDAKGGLVATYTIAIGGLAGVALHPREVFREAVRRGAASLLLAHNHPSGDPTPSEADCEATRRLIAAASVMGIPLLDHLVIGQGRYVSLRASTVLWGEFELPIV
ncbi:MAG: DNA repair protein RadC [Cyanobacteria bacterium NC_groundwater_1444_Ag_S-0.65um_54_12]|nr:DNA repair protein RadC [Cyanobacteria bacterium NC_groundwater_1444_Ag_S-0.65um_54_12]